MINQTVLEYIAGSSNGIQLVSKIKLRFASLWLFIRAESKDYIHTVVLGKAVCGH